MDWIRLSADWECPYCGHVSHCRAVEGNRGGGTITLNGVECNDADVECGSCHKYFKMSKARSVRAEIITGRQRD